MERQRYSAADITVLSWDEAVRKRLAMYFGVDRRHPDLPTRILAALIMDALHRHDGECGRKAAAVVKSWPARDL
ncbi:hypothetical protein ACFFMN_15730 [Planobispora siamensis]|uniref:Uncharacterized protein n=1 Tax=Planobispora siamensis TaxID=936338 RepID=A0A8J3WMZ1_9ACTN|nr:hypothetical protein [Planobispora siamensis]GIH93932.1 hypothetical protein Psi01_45620 [Planobispora siamensis]